MTNAVGSEVSGTMTFVVTGHLTKLTNQFVDWVGGSSKQLSKPEKTAVVLNASAFFGFFAGAAFACVLRSRQWLNNFGIFSAIGVSYAALWLAHDMEDIGGAFWLRKDDELCDLSDDGGICD